MDIQENVAQWLRTMGYNGDIPDSLSSICNSSTSFIWEQLIENVRPKNDAKHIKRNVIVNRLKIKPLDEQNQFPIKIKEIERLQKQLRLKEKIKLFKDSAEEKQDKLQRLSQNCKLKKVAIKHLKKKVKENEQRKYILDLKKQQLEEQKFEAEETLKRIKNVTPIEMEESNSPREITEVLEKCAKKLSEILMEDINSSAGKEYNKTIYSSKKPRIRDRSNGSSIASHLSMRESKVALTSYNCKTKLFDSCQVVVEEMKQDNGCSDDVLIKNNARESLGLLPESCLSKMDCSDLMNLSIESNNVFMDHDFSDVSASKLNKKHKLIQSNKMQSFEKSFINPTIEKLLHNNNRQLIHETLYEIIGNLNGAMHNILSLPKGTQYTADKNNKMDIAKLHFVHVQMGLKIMQQTKILDDLEAKVVQKKGYALNSLIHNSKVTNAQEWLDFSIRLVELDAIITAMKKEIDSSSIKDDEFQLHFLSSKIHKIKNEIATKISSIYLILAELTKTQELLISAKEEAANCVWPLKMFKTDAAWMDPFSKQYFTNELNVFENFPLEYQRRCTFTEPKTYYRDLCVDIYPQTTKMEPETLQMLCEILINPFSPPETILLNIIKAKKKLEILKMLQNKTADSFKVKYAKQMSFEVLQKQESYLEFAVERLKALMFSSQAEKTLLVGNFVKKTMDIWVAMPMKDVISSKRLVDGHDYQFYQSKLNY